MKLTAELQNCVADALSRLPPISMIQSVTADSNIEPQPSATQDEWYDRKYYRVESHPERHPDWRVEDGRLYYFRKDFLKMELSDPCEEWKLVVPWIQRITVLRECHDDPSSGHLGIAKTHWRVGRSYFWPEMYRDIVRYVQRCNVCQRVKPRNTPPAGSIHPRYVQRPWEVVSTDIMGPFPRSPQGHTNLLVFMDVFSKWVELVPLKKVTSRVILDKFRSVILNRYGATVQISLVN